MKAILSNSSQKLLWLEINQNAECSLRKKFIVSFIIFGTLAFPITLHYQRLPYSRLHRKYKI